MTPLVGALDEAIPHQTEIPATPPPEVLDALDRTARLLGELDRRGVLLGVHHDDETGAVSLLVEHVGHGVHELTGAALLDFLDGGPAVAR
jgi:hypothetical protein